MFGWLTSRRRIRAASLLAVMYALCLLAPAAAMAANPNPAMAHCLTDDHHGMSAGHADDSGASHHHSHSGDDEKGQAGKCCGLFSVAAIVTSADFQAWQHAPASHVAFALTENMTGRGTDRIDRPPRSLTAL